MKRTEAILAMRNDPKVRIRHKYFDSTEWLSMTKDGYVYSEDGIDWGADSSDWYNTCLTLPSFEDGWEIRRIF